MLLNIVKILFLHGYREFFSKKKSKEVITFSSNDVRILSFDKKVLLALSIEPHSINDETEFFLICHGIGSDRHRASKLANLSSMKDKNAVFFVIDYRSFGGSEGEFSIENGNKDIDRVIRYLKEMYHAKKIHFIGHSLGCAVVLEYCKYLKQLENHLIIGEVFCFAPFTTLLDVISDMWFLRPFTFIIKWIIPKDINYDNLKNISFLESRLHLFHGKKDTLINFRHSEKLAKLSKSTNLILTEDETHNSVFGFNEHWTYIFNKISENKKK
ncbi:hypothetical protein GINT2_002228 [Glugoides intestinalis]